MSNSCFVCCIGPRSPKISENVTSRVDAMPDTVEIAIGLNAHERKLIKDTADIIFSQLHLQNKGVAFLIAFFKAYPHHQRYFKTFRGIPPDELKSIPHTENHGRRVMNQMALLVQHLEEPAIIKDQLNDLLCKHNPRNVKPRQMKDMLNMFVEFIRQHLGPKFTSQHEAAWKKMISHILAVLEDASLLSNGSTGAIDNGRVSHASEQNESAIQTEQNSYVATTHEDQHEELDVIRQGSDDDDDDDSRSVNVAVVDSRGGDVES